MEWVQKTFGSVFSIVLTVLFVPGLFSMFLIKNIFGLHLDSGQMMVFGFIFNMVIFYFVKVFNEKNDTHPFVAYFYFSFFIAFVLWVCKFGFKARFVDNFLNSF
mgnify:CR=1 FL=1